MGAGCSAPCCCGVRPQTPQRATQVHTNFLINYLSLPGISSRSRPSSEHPSLTRFCSIPAPWAPLTPPATLLLRIPTSSLLQRAPAPWDKFNLEASSTTASPADGLAARRGAKAGKGAGLPKILPGGEGRQELQAASQGCKSRQSS